MCRWNKVFAGSKSIVTIASRMALWEVKRVKHVIFIIELTCFDHIEAHASVNISNFIELNHQWVFATTLDGWDCLIWCRWRRNIDWFYIC